MSQRCVDLLKKRYANKIPEKTIEDIVSTMSDIKDEYNMAQLSKRFREQSITDLKAQKALKIKRVADRVKLRKFADEIYKDGINEDNMNDAFLAKYFGLEKTRVGGNRSVDMSFKAAQGRLLNTIDRYYGDDIKLLASGELDVEIAKAIDDLNHNRDVSHIDENILRLAKKTKDVNKVVVEFLHDMGVPIVERQDFIWRQSHDGSRIREAGLEKWKEEFKKRVDPVKTFGPDATPSRIDKAIEEIFNDITELGGENRIGNFGGKRTIHFKSGEDFANYNAIYGRGTMLQTIVATSNSAAKHAAYTDVLGIDAKDSIKFLEDYILNHKMVGNPELKKKFMDSSPGVFHIRALGTGAKKIRSDWEKEIFGYNRHEGKEIFGKLASAVNQIQIAAKLGFSLPTTLSDSAFSSAASRAFTHEGWIKHNAFTSFTDMMKLVPSDKLQEVGSLMNMHFSTHLADTMDRLGTHTGDQSFNSSLAKWSMKKINKIGDMSLMKQQSDRQKAANTGVISGYLYSIKETPWESLLEPDRANLQRHDISPEEWDLIRTHAVTESKDVLGVNLLTPESLLENTKKLNIKSEKLANKFAGFLRDFAFIGSPESTGRERASLYMGYGPNTLPGALLRMMGTFKSFSLAIPRTMRRIQYMNDPNLDSLKISDYLSNAGALPFLGGLVTEALVTSTLAYYARDWAKYGINKAAGQPAIEPTMTPERLVSALTSTVMPIYANTMAEYVRTGDYTRIGYDVLGPGLSDATKFFMNTGDAIKALHNPNHDQALKQSGKSFRKAMQDIERNVPGITIPGVRAVLHKTILDDFYDFINPGFKDRLINKQVMGNGIYGGNR